MRRMEKQSNEPQSSRDALDIRAVAQLAEKIFLSVTANQRVGSWEGLAKESFYAAGVFLVVRNEEFAKSPTSVQAQIAAQRKQTGDL